MTAEFIKRHPSNYTKEGEPRYFNPVVAPYEMIDTENMVTIGGYICRCMLTEGYSLQRITKDEMRLEYASRRSWDDYLNECQVIIKELNKHYKEWKS